KPSREHSDLAGAESVEWDSIAAVKYDVAIISTAHDSVDHDKLAGLIPLVIDTRGVCGAADNVVKA
ncbi:MAG: nucleotide sugar dehydrogenase, partial [Kiritimatiellae bacterium]|nr:nucleotide sugar dehydrogenase [Kiritimatiellia bacterium]